MEILKIYNNNIVAVLTDTNQVALVTGRGIGHKVRGKKELPFDESYQLFKLSEPNKQDIQQIIDRIDVESLEIAREIFIKAQATIDYLLLDSLLLQLADHISFKIEMFHQDIIVPNLLMTEIKVFYPKEFAVGQFGVALVNKKYKTHFDDDEASYLAMHVLNSSMRGNNTDVYRITEFIKEMIQIISESYEIEGAYNDWIYERLIVHLKFLARRLISNQKDTSEVILGDRFLRIKEMDLIKLNQVTNKANVLSKQLFEKKLSESEQIYLSIHVLRIQQLQQNK